MPRVACWNLLCWVILIGLSAWGQPPGDSPTIPDGDNWFDQAEILCAALRAYVQREQPYRSHQRYGTLSFLVTSNPNAQVYWFYLRKDR